MEMATETARQPGSQKHQRISRILKTLDKKTKPFQEFWTKFNNDWSWNNAAGLAYNLILAVFPIVITLLSILGFFLSTLDPGAYQSALDRMTSISSSLAEAKPIVAAAFQQVRKDAGLLGVIAVVLALFNGSRLFIFMVGSSVAVCSEVVIDVTFLGQAGGTINGIAGSLATHPCSSNLRLAGQGWLVVALKTVEVFHLSR